MFPWLEFLALMTAFGLSAVVPGADFAMVLRQSILHGRKTAVFTSAGVATAILVHGTYTLLGIGLVISKSLFLFSIIKIIGVVYLLWMGISVFRAPAPVKPDFKMEKVKVEPSVINAFVLGFLTNLLNPKAVLFFLALFSSLVSAETALAYKSFYVVMMSVLLFIWFVLVSIFFTTPSVRGLFYRIGKWFNRVTGATLVMLAIGVAASSRG
ncbi:LysE family transporter [Lentilitoribacter sp. EG35]|uniref:LysE family transporter n=1 Tax=Lentilitoribacter sp. Alg239-R112 TaxID=2305987 RepID=UPI0013A6B5A1|nr:LysE family transporter [Lentilitoribacter sp. Alg239-R112]